MWKFVSAFFAVVACATASAAARTENVSPDPIRPCSYVMEHSRELNGPLVIPMTVYLNTPLRQTPVNLQDRTSFTCRLLISRQSLRAVYFIDPARFNILQTKCPAADDIG